MKFIYFPVAVISDEWRARAEQATATMEGKSPGKEQLDYIGGQSKVWADLKPTLESLSNGKCWYSEARDKVSYWHVDHYRPKSLYPWLAFNWQNLRLCGGVPNTHKLNSFPLESEEVRATEAKPSCDVESPLLLDPLKWGDPELLTFNANGEPACAQPSNALAVDRVTKTIAILELDREALCAERRAKWRLCERKLKLLRQLLETQRQQQNVDAGNHFNELCQDLSELYADSAEFTATAWACARELNSVELIELARQQFSKTSTH